MRKQNGITLIALVITIIVLLILAGVSLSLVLGNNGVLTQSKSSVEENRKARAKEDIEMAWASATTEYYNDWATDTSKNLIDYYTKEKLDNYLTNGEITTDPVLSNGEYTVTYELNENGVKYAYTFTVDSNGKISGGTLEGGEEATLPEDAVVSLAKAGEIQRWDRINYNPGTATTAGITLPNGASIDGVINASDATDWVVLDVNQTTGEVLIMPKTFSDVNLQLTSGINGYNDFVEAVNAIVSIYKNPNYAANTQGLSTAILSRVTGYEDYFMTQEITHTGRYGVDNNLNIIDSGQGNAYTSNFVGALNYDVYHRFGLTDVKNTFGQGLNTWLTDRVAWVNDSYLNVCVRQLWTGDGNNDAQLTVSNQIWFDGDNFYTVYADTYELVAPVVPIVTLKPNAQLESSSKFYTKTATATVTSETQTDEFTYEHSTWSFK